MGTFQSQSKKSIDAAFAEFDKKNPLVWKKFESEVFRAIHLGRTKISAKQLIGYIRWYVSIQTTDPKWKINDAFTSRYARKFASKNKKYQHIFEYRELRSGTETLKKQFLSPPEITVLKRAHAGYMVKIGKSLYINWQKDKQQQLDNYTFNRLIALGLLQCTTGESRIQKWKPTPKAKKYLKSISKK